MLDQIRHVAFLEPFLCAHLTSFSLRFISLSSSFFPISILKTLIKLPVDLYFQSFAEPRLFAFKSYLDPIWLILVYFFLECILLVSNAYNGKKFRSDTPNSIHIYFFQQLTKRTYKQFRLAFVWYKLFPFLW